MYQNKTHYFTSESVTEGHPDKICDRISDSILDEILKQDKNARVACETIATTNLVLVMGEISTSAKIDYEKVIKDVFIEVGYDDFIYLDDFETIIRIDKQSPDIAQGVNSAMDKEGDSLGAGDQGIMFGYACDETDELMPLPITLAHKLAKKLTDVRKSGELGYLRPDGKSQVTVKYENSRPVYVDTVVISSQHLEEISLEKLREDIYNKVILKIIPKNLINEKTKIFINPTGRFVIGGPEGDSGLTGRKIIVDTYGGYAPHGGGAFSGKDPTKVDRSAAYMARYLAKNVVASGVARKCQIQLAYAIGVAEPVSILVETFGTSSVDDEKISDVLKDLFDLTPSGIINYLDLRKPIYRNLSAYGHVGRDDIDGLNWEKIDIADELKEKLK